MKDAGTRSRPCAWCRTATGPRARGYGPRRGVSGLYAITPEDADTDRLARKVRAALAGGAHGFDEAMV